MDSQHESNPHFLPRRRDPVIEVAPPRRPRKLPQTSVQPPYAPRPQPPLSSPPPHHESMPHFVPDQPPHESRPPPYFAPDQPHQESRYFANDQPRHEFRPHFAPLQPPHESRPDSKPHSVSEPLEPHSPGRGHRPRRQQSDNLRVMKPQRTHPMAWLLAAVCALFWLIVIIGGLVILIVYLVFRPRSPRFDVSTATLNAAYLDMGYLLNADVTLLANFTNPNTKVNVDFTYIVLDIYYEKHFIATRYIDPFSVMRRESRFADVHMVASQVALSMGHSLELQRQITAGRVSFEIKGLFKTRSRFGGFFQYTYWLYTHCQIVVAGPPTGVLIGKKCITKR